MHESSAKLYCPNPTCQATNLEKHEFCQICRTALPKRYLWAISLEDDIQEAQLGELWGDRYLLKGSRIVLDTRPGLFPDLPEMVPKALEPYLRLFPYRWHLPQVYGRAGAPSQLKGQTVWLLENAPIRETSLGCWELQPSLDRSWTEADPLRQLNWLWQIAQLWEPFVQEGVGSSLLDLERLRVEGGFVRLSDLSYDSTPPTLSQLGQLWSRWINNSAPALQDFLDRLCASLCQGQIATIEQLFLVLDRALDLVSRSYQYQTQTATLSDRGPSRARNEDACYPVAGNVTESSNQTLAIVCDGVGGHEGGDIASNLAIHIVERNLRDAMPGTSRVSNSNSAAVRDRERPRLSSRRHSSIAARTRLELVSSVKHAIFEANDTIGDRNNLEQRHGRQRMGTTLVMAMTIDRDLYVTHIGDSRAYLISRYGCYPITLDDDVATREVRLGYAFYREALQQTAAGSLIQALGMGPSYNLHPTINRFVIDEDCICLLCSDGLSDYDRVEQSWHSEIQPLLEDRGDLDLQSVAVRLVEIANTHNGHDNVTVALVRVRVRPKAGVEFSSKALLACFDNLPKADNNETVTLSRQEDDNTSSTEFLSPPTPRSSYSPIGAAIVMALSIGIAGSIVYHVGRLGFADRGLSDRPDTPPSTSTPQPENTLFPEPGERPVPDSGTIVRLQSSLVLRTRPRSDAPILSFDLQPERVVRVGQVVQNRREGNRSQIWLELHSCDSIDAPNESNEGFQGWVEWSKFQQAGFELLEESSQRNCPVSQNEDG
ncbi:MAG: protein phosphatase 2C domain-containing protein [Cyanobacteria bacterium SID2]|nr:protein phosphatase 2C domain-containing protein [Cyanobacteria bacterium SID2]